MAPRSEDSAKREPPPLPLRTERLVLRGLTLGDVDDVHAYRGRDDVARFLLHPSLSHDETHSLLQRWLGQEGDHLGLGMEYDGRIVGDVVLAFKPHDQAELGWVLNPDAAGLGLATEAARALLEVAFGHYGCHRVYADLDARNERSKSLCERLGMRLEMHALQDFWSKGEWTDTFRYALLHEEYVEMASTAPPA